MLKLDFCSRFGYPDNIRLILQKIIEALDREGVVSVIALGSLPRGELSFRAEPRGLFLFSDIELMVVTEKGAGRERKAVFFAALDEIKKEFQKTSPLFDIAVEFMALRDFERLPFRVRFYELKKSGEVIYGQDVRGRMPSFEARSLDVRDTNNIILRRLLSILVYLPEELIKNRKISLAEDVFRYIIARNALDIATVRLFQKGIFPSTYREKVEYIVSRPGDFINDFGPDFPPFLAECLNIKLRMDPNRRVTGLFDSAIEYFRTLLILTLRDNGINAGTERGLSILTKKPKADIFGEADITKVKLNFVLKSANPAVLCKRLDAVLSCSFLGCVIFFLLNMNEAACLFLKGDRRSLSVLDDSWWALMRLGVLSGKEGLPIDFIGRFLVLRKKFLSDFYTKLISPASAGHIDRVLNWRYE